MTGNTPREPMLTPRTTLIILIGLLAGLATGLLLGRAGHSPHEAVLAGIAAFAATVKFVDWLIA